MKQKPNLTSWVKASVLTALAGVLLVTSAWAQTAPATTPAPTPAAAPSPTPAPPPAPDSIASPPGLNAGTVADLQWPVPADFTNPDVDTAKKTVTPAELVQNVAHNKISINLVWTLITGFLVMFMQAGFALVEAGLCRAKNAAHVFSMNFLIYALGMLGFWICGFAFMFGGWYNAPVAIGWQPSLGQGLSILANEWTIDAFGKTWGILGHKGFFLGSDVFDTSIFALFLFQMVFMDTTATIPTGSMAERWSFKNFMIYGFWVGMIPYPLFGNWVWGGGWLAQLGVNAGLGHGHVDFAGSSVVHLTGGVIGFVGAWVAGARLGKFTKDGKANAIPGHNLGFVFLGTFILAFGWFGFNPGSTLAGTDNRISIVAVNTMLASASGALVTCLTMWFLFGKPDPSMMCNGFLAGLVAITAPCAFVNSLGAVLIGAVSGVLVIAAVFFVERTLKIDDPVGAIAVHGFNGFWGVLSVGIFANGSYGTGFNGVHKLFKEGQPIMVIVYDSTAATAAATIKHYNELTGTGPNGGWVDQGVTGILGKYFGGAYNDSGQLLAEFIGGTTNVIVVGLLALIWFKLSNLIFPIRPSKEDEIKGLDIPEMGAEAYPDYQLTDRSSPAIS